MALSPETLREINALVRGGFEERAPIIEILCGDAPIIEILCGEMYEPGELDEAEVIAAVDAAFTALAQDKATWPTITDCDRLDGAFAAPNGTARSHNASSFQPSTGSVGRR
jgi:hypothetical protein